VQFAQPEYLWLLWILPLLWALFWSTRGAAARRTAAFTGTALGSSLVLGRNERRRVWRAAIRLLLLSQIILALARPQWGASEVEVEQEGIDLVIALDVSQSMMAEDIKPSRLARAKVELFDLLERRAGDRVGLVFFAGAAFPQCPLTVDYAAARLFLSQAEPTMIGSQGTDLESALRTALELFGEDRGAYRAILLVTDGEDFATGIEAVTDELVEAGVAVFPVGLGSVDGAPIPVFDQQGRREGYLRGKDGEVVMTHLEEAPLLELARRTGGIYVRAGSGGLDLARLSAGLETLQSHSYQATRVTSYQERYAWPLGAALLLFFFEPLLADRRRGE
jgi:Ca-activated chloride channel family protein